MKNFERYPVGYGPCAKNHPPDDDYSGSEVETGTCRSWETK